MKIKIEFDTDNAAFEDAGPGNEVARILRELAGKFERANDLMDLAVEQGRQPLYDLNGNPVGSVVVTK